MIALAIVVHVLVTYTVIGREIYAIGDNPKAARLAGVNIKATRLVVLLFADFSPGSAA